MRYVLLVWGASSEPCCAAFTLCQVEMDTSEMLGACLYMLARKGPCCTAGNWNWVHSGGRSWYSLNMPSYLGLISPRKKAWVKHFSSVKVTKSAPVKSLGNNRWSYRWHRQADNWSCTCRVQSSETYGREGRLCVHSSLGKILAKAWGKRRNCQGSEGENQRCRTFVPSSDCGTLRQVSSTHWISCRVGAVCSAGNCRHLWWQVFVRSEGRGCPAACYCTSLTLTIEINFNPGQG